MKIEFNLDFETVLKVFLFINQLADSYQAHMIINIISNSQTKHN